MIIVDTSIWIDFFKQKQPIDLKLEQLLEERNIIALDCIFGELLQGSRIPYERDMILDYWANLPKFIDSQIIIEAGLYSSENKLITKGVGLIDSIIIVTAIKTKSKVWTLDKKLLDCIPDKLIFK